jgi:NitT/TauT family transport system substrate-binding protein
LGRRRFAVARLIELCRGFHRRPGRRRHSPCWCGPHTFNVVWATSKFTAENPLLLRAFVDALADCMALITKDPKRAAAIWVAAEKSKMPVDEAERLIRLPENEWTMTPKKVTAYAEFMNRVGVLPVKPADWKEVFFDVVHDLAGS